MPIPGGGGELITAEEVKGWIQDRRTMPLSDLSRDVRLSLAGAQDKIPVIFADGALYLPVRGSPSTHRLKLPSRDYKQLPENEHCMTSLARAFGLDAHKSEPYPVGRVWLTIATRYDRIKETVGLSRRLHQEDFCQALGFSHFKSLRGMNCSDRREYSARRGRGGDGASTQEGGVPGG